MKVYRKKEFQSIMQLTSVKGAALTILGRYQEVIYSYNKVLDINPGLINAWVGKGAALYGPCKYNDALYCSEESIKINPNLKESYQLRNIILQRLSTP